MIRLVHSNPENISLFISWEQSEDTLPFIQPYLDKEHFDVIESNNKEHLTVMNNTKPIGFVILNGIDNKLGAIELKRIVISEKGNGFGNKTLDAVISRCFEKHLASKIWLDVYENNKRASHLYLKKGFIPEPTSLSKGNFSEGRELIIMSIEKGLQRT